jgi:hypothetical protein
MAYTSINSQPNGRTTICHQQLKTNGENATDPQNAAEDAGQLSATSNCLRRLRPSPPRIWRKNE